jgi:exodeoxyribonuclease VII large subunit
MNDSKYLSVTEFTRIIKNNLEISYPFVFLRGEISNLRPSTSGHYYFSLKDETSSIKAVIFRNNLSILSNFDAGEGIKDGKEVLIEGRMSVYERGGEYSIIVSKIIPVGIGELAIKFEILKKKLDRLGLFDPAIKKPLPMYPNHIGIVTSPTGAALKDILNVLKRRFSSLKITVFPALVQGEQAKDDIAKAIKCANYHYENNTENKVDVLIVARGGGSIEDLWAFNEEVVAYAIYESKIPIITGIGHEIDYTIADFCADLRAPTPSAAAEIVVRNTEELINSISAYRLRIQTTFDNYLEKLFYRLDNCRLERLTLLLKKIYENNLQDFSHIEEKLKSVFDNIIKKQKQKFYMLLQKLNDISPLNTLSRGYSITLKNDAIVKSYNQVERGDDITILLAEGKLSAVINEKFENNNIELN